MKPSNEDDPIRKDGWFPHKGTWGEVTVGTVIINNERPAQRWEVIATGHGETPIPIGYTLWVRIREQKSGEEHSLEPRPKSTPVTILTEDPRDTETAPPTEPSDTEAILNLIKGLDAELLASRDSTTGEITCPDYIYSTHLEGGMGGGRILKGLLQHLRIAHGMEVEDGLDIGDAGALHGQAHNPKWPGIGKGGFPHRHVPESTFYPGES